MDKYNVIIPTNNLVELEQDMDSWNRLPYKLKKLSNTSCMIKYNCTVYDLYIRLKANILNKQSVLDADPDNLVVITTEGSEEDYYDYSKFAEFSDFPNYRHLISISRALMQDSNIVILTPDLDIDDLRNEYDRYNHLIQKFKTFSNDYSIQIWGYNVPNMYEKLYAKLDTAYSDRDANNIVNATEEAYMPLINKIITESAKCDSEFDIKSKSLVETNDIIERTVFDREYINQSQLNVSIPKVVPWFTVDEMNSLGINFTYTDPTSYLKAIKEAKSDEELLNLAWNPSVEISESSLLYANMRQTRWFNHNFVEMHDVRESSFSVFEATKLVYFIIENPIPDSSDVVSNPEGFANPTYTRYGIMLNDNTEIVYVAVPALGAYAPRELSSFSNFEVVGVFCDDKTYDAIHTKLTGNATIDIDRDCGAIYKYIFNRADRLDRTKEKMVYAYMRNELMNIAGVDKTDETSFFIKGFYRLFKGRYEDYDFDKISNIVTLVDTNT